MGFFGILSEERSIENPNIPITADQLALLSSFGPTVSGVQINAQTALTFSAVFAAVRVISESLGSMEINVFKQLTKGKAIAPAMPAHRLLSSQANEYMTAAVFLETFFANMVLWGYAAAKIEYDNAGRAARLLPFMSKNSRAVRKGGELVYQVDSASGTDTYFWDEVLYVPGLSLNGIEALSPIAYHREAIGMGKAAEAFGAALFGNGGNVGGILTHPGNLSDKARKNMEDSWNRKHQGAGSASKIAVLEEGLKYERIGIPPEDAQFLQTRKFQVNEIARIFRVPPHMLGDLDRSTNNNIEQQSLDFLTNTLATYMTKFQQECDRKLLPTGGQYCTRFNTRTLLRGDIKTRMAFYASGRQWGFLSANDVREMEDLNDIEGGDTYLTPVNMVDVADPEEVVGELEQPDPTTPPTVDADDADPVSPPPKKKKKSRAMELLARALSPYLLPAPSNAVISAPPNLRKLAKSHARLFADAAERLVRKEARAVERFDGRDAAGFDQWADKFYAEHREHMRSAFIAPVYSLAECVVAGDGLAVEIANEARAALDAYVDADIKAVRESLRTAFSAGKVKEFMQTREISRPAAVATELSQKIVDLVTSKSKG